MRLNGESNGKLKFGAKSEFVRSLDRAMPAAQVVALAAARGMKMSPGFVYNIRSVANGKARHAAPDSRVRSSGPPRHEALLRAAIAQLGIQRARQILAEVEATFAGG
jgi:hypothetical protein